MSSPASSSFARQPRWLWRELVYGLTVLVAAAALAWTALGGWRPPAIGPKQQDYYNLLVGGFRHGSLALDLQVPAALRNAPDPMAAFKKDPSLVPHDLSYYQGHYYSYFGVVPAVVLFWPFRTLTGYDLPRDLAALGFAGGSLLLTAWLWRRLLREHFPRASTLTEAGGLAVASLAAGQWVLVRRISIWEPSIIAGQFFVFSMLASAYQAGLSRRPRPWLCLAGLALGLAFGSRPTLVVTALALGPLIWVTGRHPAEARPWPRRLLNGLAVTLPLGVVGMLLLGYNWARFGNPFEFGMTYQLNTWNEVKQSHFHLRYLPYNLYLYFLASPRWGRYFPFVHPFAMPAAPPGYYGSEFVYGALAVAPALWWLAAAPILLRVAAPALRAFICQLFAVAVTTAAVLLCFDTSTVRYASDFLPWWMLLALLAWAALEDRIWPRLRLAARCLFGGTAMFSCATAFFCSADLYGILHTVHPDTERRLTEIFDQPTRWFEQATGSLGGPIAMELTFGAHHTQAVAPILITGAGYQRDSVYVFFQSDQVIRLCYLHPGDPLATSADLPIMPGHPYRLEIDGGELYPPAGDPVFRGWSAVEVEARKHWARLIWEGKVVLSVWQGANEASPGTFQIGTDDSGYCGRRFEGTIAQVRRLGIRPAVHDVSTGGDFELELELPPGPFPAALPLVQFGRAKSADIIGLRLQADQDPVLVYESFGWGLWPGAPCEPQPNHTLSLRIRLGSALALDPAQPSSILGKSVVIWQNGRPILWHRIPAAVAATGSVHLFANAFDSTEMQPTYVGHIYSASRRPPLPQWRPGPFRVLNLELAGRGDNAAEPLLCTGHAGRCDALGLEWLPGNQARLIYEHSGHRVEASPSFVWDGQKPRSLRIAAPALQLLGAAATERSGPLRVELDGAPIWTKTVTAFSGPPGEIAVGRNPAGSPSLSREFHAVVLDLGQEP